MIVWIHIRGLAYLTYLHACVFACVLWLQFTSPLHVMLCPFTDTRDSDAHEVALQEV